MQQHGRAMHASKHFRKQKMELGRTPEFWRGNLGVRQATLTGVDAGSSAGVSFSLPWSASSLATSSSFSFGSASSCSFSSTVVVVASCHRRQCETWLSPIFSWQYFVFWNIFCYFISPKIKTNFLSSNFVLEYNYIRFQAWLNICEWMKISICDQ